MVSVQLLCAGDCSGLPAVPLRPDGNAFDFGVGSRAILDGADLTIQTEGSVFVYGPVLASESISMTAADVTFLDVRLDAPEIIVNTLGNPRWNSVPGDIRIEGRHQLGLDSIDRLICACLSVLDPETLGAQLTLRSKVGSPVTEIIRFAPDGSFAIGSGNVEPANSLVLAAQAVTGRDPEVPQLPGLAISPEGDVYIDVSRVTLGSFTVKAAGSIVVAGAASMPVPEPGTALLLGLGLFGLTAHRRSGERGECDAA